MHTQMESNFYLTFSPQLQHVYILLCRMDRPDWNRIFGASLNLLTFHYSKNRESIYHPEPCFQN